MNVPNNSGASRWLAYFCFLAAFVLPCFSNAQAGIQHTDAINKIVNDYLNGNVGDGDPAKTIIVHGFAYPVKKVGEQNPNDPAAVDKIARKTLDNLIQKYQNKPKIREHLEKLKNHIWQNNTGFFDPGSEPFTGTVSANPGGNTVSGSGNGTSLGTSSPSGEIVTGNPVLINGNQPNPNPGAQEKGKCKCESVSFTVSVTKGTETTSTDVSADKFDGGSEVVKLDKPALANGDEITVKISNIKVNCPCSKGGDCPNFPASRKFKSDPDPKSEGKATVRPGSGETQENDADSSSDNFHCLRTGETSWNADFTEYTMKLKIQRYGNRNETPYQDISIRTWCGPTDDCRRDYCHRTFRIAFGGTKW